MNEMKRFAQVFLGLMLVAAQAASAVSEKVDMKLGCKNNPGLVGACFTVNGRLSTYNGNPSLRIWPAGSRRLLGVVEDESLLSIPANIRNLVGFEHDVRGSFLVCPFTEAKAGYMQFVCVEEASNVRKHDRH